MGCAMVGSAAQVLTANPLASVMAATASAGVRNVASRPSRCAMPHSADVERLPLNSVQALVTSTSLSVPVCTTT